MVSDPADVAGVICHSAVSHPEIAEILTDAAMWLIEMYGVRTAIPRQQAADSLASRFDDAEVTDAIDAWISKFAPAVGMQR